MPRSTFDDSERELLRREDLVIAAHLAEKQAELEQRFEALVESEREAREGCP